MSQPDKVLVIGDDTRSFLATVRSLGRKGVEVHVAPYNLSSSSLRSRYIHKVHHLPYYLDGGTVWLEQMSRLLKREQFKLVIPCDERSLLPLVVHQNELAAYSKLSIPDERGMDLFFDKAQTRDMAATLNIPVANGRLLRDTDTAWTVLDEVRLPLILKYRKSYSWPELYVRTGTTIIDTEAQLAAWLKKNPNRNNEILFEAMFDGFGAGLSVLCSQGKVLQAFEHHRVRELRGASYYRKSAQPDASRLDAVKKMVEYAGYTGLAMFEFKVNEATGKWILLEVNARPWGSLPLPVAAGMDFPYCLYSLLVKNEAVPPISYKSDIYGRNLVSDLWQVRSVMASLGRNPVRHSAFLAKWLWDFRRVVYRREHHDVLVWDDVRPGIHELNVLLGELLQSFRTKLIGPQPLRTGLRERISSELAKANKPLNILFLCQGNICRSPYAELKMAQLLAHRAGHFVVSSAGMLPRNRRPSPPEAVRVAASRGVDLSSHRSRHAFEDLLQSASVIILFDRINQRSLLTRYPGLADKAYFLGEFSGRGGKATELHDPEGKSEAAFNDIYEQIDTCLHHLAEVVQDDRATGIIHEVLG